MSDTRISTELNEWRKNGNYLPPELRDFHDQKDIFKLVHHTCGTQSPTLKDGSHNDTKNVSTRAAHIYVIDHFLWTLAKYGYVLKKSDEKLEFLNLQDDIEGFKNLMAEEFNEYLKITRKENERILTQEPSKQ